MIKKIVEQNRYQLKYCKYETQGSIISLWYQHRNVLQCILVTGLTFSKAVFDFNYVTGICI